MINKQVILNILAVACIVISAGILVWAITESAQRPPATLKPYISSTPSPKPPKIEIWNHQAGIYDCAIVQIDGAIASVQCFRNLGEGE